jgi:hypothetical protein
MRLAFALVATLAACTREAPSVQPLPVVEARASNSSAPASAPSPSASATPVSHINAILFVVEASIAAAAKDAVMRGVTELAAIDVGVIAYDVAPSVVVKLGAVEDPAPFEKAVGAIPARPGSALTSALRLAHTEFLATDSKLKHVVVIAAHKNDEAGAETEAKAMFKDLIGCSTFAVGKDADAKALERIGELSGGNSRAVASAKDLAPAVQSTLQIVLGP